MVVGLGVLVCLVVLGGVVLVRTYGGGGAEGDQLIGVWESADGRARIELNADSTFRAVGFPGDFAAGTADPTERIDGEGTWSVGPGDWLADQDLYLMFDASGGGRQGYLLVARNLAREGIYVPVGGGADPGLAYRYTRVQQSPE
ncbi:hypothetical protein [Allostreptomyces psammosilenae]|uniref:Uncharacterized protein n=1 Tax=Allostreptomyces psammosilenae TaxID=1892865 RepID=A0A852ZZ35_9ACTN|nr:hypothetical protein [Allostreptomyces psammosilenae]NYI03378.1 hypothetical protein [Allostreptomyces psammosilenae]